MHIDFQEQPDYKFVETTKPQPRITITETRLPPGFALKQMKSKKEANNSIVETKFTSPKDKFTQKVSAMEPKSQQRFNKLDLNNYYDEINDVQAAKYSIEDLVQENSPHYSVPKKITKLSTNLNTSAYSKPRLPEKLAERKKIGLSYRSQSPVGENIYYDLSDRSKSPESDNIYHDISNKSPIIERKYHMNIM